MCAVSCQCCEKCAWAIERQNYDKEGQISHNASTTNDFGVHIFSINRFFSLSLALHSTYFLLLLQSSVLCFQLNSCVPRIWLRWDSILLCILHISVVHDAKIKPRFILVVSIPFHMSSILGQFLFALFILFFSRFCFYFYLLRRCWCWYALLFFICLFVLCIVFSSSFVLYLLFNFFQSVLFIRQNK